MRNRATTRKRAVSGVGLLDKLPTRAMGANGSHGSWPSLEPYMRCVVAVIEHGTPHEGTRVRTCVEGEGPWSRGAENLER